MINSLTIAGQAMGGVGRGMSHPEFRESAIWEKTDFQKHKPGDHRPGSEMGEAAQDTAWLRYWWRVGDYRGGEGMSQRTGVRREGKGDSRAQGHGGRSRHQGVNAQHGPRYPARTAWGRRTEADQMLPICADQELDRMASPGRGRRGGWSTFTELD